MHTADHLGAPTTRHVYVEKNDVWLRRRDDADRLVDVTGLADDVDRIAELCSHTAADEPMVVDEDDAHGVTHSASRARLRHDRSLRDTLNATSVPVGPVRMLPRPPC